MTCSKDFGRLLQAACLGLIGTLAFAGCGGSETKPDSGIGPTEAGPDALGPAVLHLNTTTLHLGTIDAKTGGVGTVTVTNIGKQTSGSITIVGSAGITATGCTSALPAGQSCSITIQALPTVTSGTFTGTVTISANPGASPTPLQVSVTAQVATFDLFDVAPRTIPLGNLAPGEAAPRQLIQVTAKVNLNDLVFTASGPDIRIDQAATTCTTILAMGSSCSIAVTFQATTPGAKSDSVVITAGGAAAQTVTVPITATVQVPVTLVMNPTTANFTAEIGKTSSPVSFGVGNIGDVASGPLTVAITGTGTAASNFSQTNNCLPLPSLGSCTITVLFKPAATAPAGVPITATLTVTDSAGTATASATLTGTPTEPSTLQITSSTTDLGTVMVGQTGTPVVFTVTNVGGAASGALTAAILLSSEFTITSDGCSNTSIQPAGTCTLSVALKPASAGAKTATLSVSGTAVANPARKTITGIGITGPIIEVTPASLDFQSVRVNNMGTEQTVTVKNVGGTATGAIVINKTGDFDAFPVTSNGCSAPLAPLVGTCTFTVNFAPTTVGAFTANFTVTDGTTSDSVIASGTALKETGLMITPSPVGACAEPPLGGAPNDIVYTNCFPATVVGGSRQPVIAVVDTDGGVTMAYSSTPITFVVKATSMPAGVTDTGALTVGINPATPADFTILSSTCTTPLLLNATCQISVAFTPTALGLRQASLVVTSANGGSDAATMQGIGLSLLEIRPLDIRAKDGTEVSGLDFGQVPVLTDKYTDHDYLVIVRGPNSATADTSQVLVTLTDPSQPADFYYTTSSRVNPCNTTSNQAVTVDFGDGTITGDQGFWHYDSSLRVFTCEFTVRFAPQSTKGAKTATLTADGSGPSQDVKELTGTATGPLTFNPSPASFSRTLQVGESTNTQTSISAISLSGEDVTVTLENHSTTTDYGPITLTKGGTNPDEFLIVGDTCSTVTLVHHAANADPKFCLVSLAFVPKSAGAKSMVLTATGGSTAGPESANVTINAGAADPLDITIAPDQYNSATGNVHDFGTVPQTADSTWVAFTITNPTGAPNSAQVDFGIGASPDGTETSDAYGKADGTNHVFGTCGNTGTTTLEPGKSCYFWVRFMPSASEAVTTATAAPLTGWIYAYDKAKDKYAYVKGSGKVSSVVTIAPATYTFPDTPGGATSAATTLTVGNRGSTAISLVIPPNDANLAPFNIDQSTGCAGLGSTGLAAGATCPLVVTFVGIASVATTGQSILSEVDLTVSASSFGTGASATTALTGTSVVPAKLVAVGYANPDGAWSNTINLGGVRVGGSSADVTLLFKNVGSVPTSSLTYQWSGGTANTQDAEFIINTEDPTRCAGKTSLGAGETCTVSIHFTPSASETVGVQRDADTKRFTLSAVTGGLVQVFRFTAWSLDPASSGWIGISGGANAFYTFPGSAVGMNSSKPTTGFPTQVFQLTNGTAASATPLNLALSDEANFTLITSGTAAGATPCGTTLSASNSCTFAVGFRPDAYTSTTAYRHATVTATAGPFNGAVLGVYGRVQIPPVLAITPSQAAAAVDPYDFGQVVVNSTVPAKAFTVTNTGETTSAPITIALSGDTSGGRFNVGGGCNAALAAGASCVGSITYSPPVAPAVAPVSAQLQATAGTVAATETPTVMAWPLNDTTLTVLPISLTFPTQSVGTVSSTSKPVVLTNENNSMTSGLLTIALAGDDPTNFSISVGGTCPVYTDPTAKQGLIMLGTCTVQVSYTPKALPEDSTHTAELRFSATPGSLKTVPITGTAQSALHIVDPGPINLNPPSIDDPETIWVYLDSGAPQTAYLQTGITGGNFAIVEDHCVATKLRGGEACSIEIAPLYTSATPNKTATLSVNGGSAGNSATLTLNSSS